MTDASRAAVGSGQPAEVSTASASIVSPGWKRRVGFFLAGQTASLLGSSVVQYAIFWHLTLESRSGSVMTLAILFGFLPQAIISIFAGVWADRLNRKLLIMGSDAVIALTTLGLAVSFLSGITDLWIVCLALTIRSVGAGIQTPAVSAMIPQIAPPRQLLRVNGIVGSVQAAMSIAAPAIAAALYASWGLQATFFLDVITAVIGIALLSRIPLAKIDRSAEGEPVGYLADLRDGLTYLWRVPVFRWLLGYLALIMFLVVPPSFLTPLMVVRTFGDDVWRLTAMEISFGAGMVLAGVIVATWAARFENRLRLIALAAVAFGVVTVGLGLSTVFWVFLAFMFLCGLAVPFFNTPMFTIFQERAEPEMQGRVFGVVSIVTAVTMPVGMGLIGPLADHVSVELLLVITGAITLVAGLWGLRASERLRSQVSAPVAGAESDTPGAPPTTPGAPPTR